MTAMPDLSGVLVLPEDKDDARRLGRAADACRDAATAADLLTREGIAGARNVDAAGRITIHGEEHDSIRWIDDRANGGMMAAEHWRPIPQGEEGAGDRLRRLALRWPIRSSTEFFQPRTIADIAAIMRAGMEVCQAARNACSAGSIVHEPFATALRSTLHHDLVYNVPTPWCSALLEVFIDSDEEPTGYDEDLLRLVTSRIPAAVSPKLLSKGDDHRVIVMPHEMRMHDFEVPGTLETLRALAAIEAMPVLREPRIQFGRTRRPSPF